ncbi:MAG: DNA methyltransferase [Solirubrobacteraceae bacterium]
MVRDRSWFAVDGELEPLAYEGDTSFRFPERIAQHVLERFSGVGDWVLDPFCGFGTTLVVAERLGRNAAGIEIDRGRAAFAATRVSDPSRVLHGCCADIEPGRWPLFDLVLTSPPYGSFTDGSRIDAADDYVASATRLFHQIARVLAPGAVLAVEVAQARESAATRPIVWHVGRALCSLFVLQEDIVRVNTGATEAGLGYDHSHILVFRNEHP